ncbi:MAG: aldo/keto reductase [Ktedonobacteraceae bacterium]
MVYSLRPLGATGFHVTPLCIGCAALGNMPETFTYGVEEDSALALIRAIFASPINFIDTAAAYGDGESERRIGKVLHELGGIPPGFVLATKADRNLQTGEFTGAQMLRSVERSLRLLGLASLPVCFLHDPEHLGFEAAMAPGGSVEMLLHCQQEGMIRHLGIAGGPVEMLTRFVETGLFEVAISHNRYTLLNQDAAPFWDVCQHRHVAAINAAPYGSGMLAKGPSVYPRYEYAAASQEYLRRAFAIEAMCSRYEVPLAAVALQFSLRDPRIVSTIVGISKPERLPETLMLAAYPLSEQLWEELATLDEDNAYA